MFPDGCEGSPRFLRSTGSVSDSKVLVVDDEEYIRDLVSSALRIAGFQSLSAPEDGSLCPALGDVAAATLAFMVDA